MKIFIMIVHILSMFALAVTGVVWLAIVAFTGLVGLFKHDIVPYGLVSLVCAASSQIAGIITFIFANNSKWLLQLDPVRWKKHELVMDCSAAGVFFIDLFMLWYFSGFDPAKIFDTPMFVGLTAIWTAGIVFNSAAAVITVKKI